MLGHKQVEKVPDRGQIDLLGRHGVGRAVAVLADLGGGNLVKEKSTSLTPDKKPPRRTLVGPPGMTIARHGVDEFLPGELCGLPAGPRRLFRRMNWAR